jgi:hypothetical protein
MSTTVVRALPENEWRRAVAEHPAGNIFHTPEMFEVYSRTKGCRPELWAAVNEQGHVLAMLTPVQVTLVDRPLVRGFTTRAVAYGSIMCRPSPEDEEALCQLLRAYEASAVKNWVLFTELRHTSDMSGLAGALADSGFVPEEHLNFQLDLNRPVDNLWSGMTKSGRQAVQRSRNKGVVTEDVKDRSLIPIFYQLVHRTFLRARVPLADISLFEAIFDVLVPRGMAKMVMAQVNGQYAAASVTALYKGVMFGWYMGFDESLRTARPNDSVMWHMIEWGAENGFQCLDFGGAGKPGESYGPRDFKAKFGPQLVSFGRHTRVHHPRSLAVSRFVYAMYRKALRYSTVQQGSEA